MEKEKPRLVLNTSEDYEPIEVWLDPVKTPKAYALKLKELIEAGMTEGDAKNLLAKHPIELELYYHYGCGLFAVESEVTECTTIYSPYTAEEYELAEEN